MILSAAGFIHPPPQTSRKKRLSWDLHPAELFRQSLLRGIHQAENILEMDEYTYANVLNPRFWYIGCDSLWLWKCNALRVMINDGDKKYHSLIKKHSEHDDRHLRDIAAWGCEKLGI